MHQTNSDFLRLLLRYYVENGRLLPWRTVGKDGTSNPYHILVSELMLQQTQVERVIPKYEAFLARFPTLQSLAEATLGEVIELWSGLGYNRRAKYLHDASKVLVQKDFPREVEQLVVLKGVSKNTASAILTYAFNQKHVFVETNIRTVIIDTFFADNEQVTDKEIEVKLAELLKEYHGSYRDFYWALMDYGTFLKKSGNKAHKRSTAYKKQARFQGSVRQLRGELIRRAQARQSLAQVRADLSDKRLESVLSTLVQEGLLRVTETTIEIA